MINSDEKSNAQDWELEVTCKNKEYLDEVVGAILKQGLISFQVESIEGSFDKEDKWQGRYLVLMWCSWFNNLNSIVKELKKIEKKLER